MTDSCIPACGFCPCESVGCDYSKKMRKMKENHTASSLVQNDLHKPDEKRETGSGIIRPVIHISTGLLHSFNTLWKNDSI